jgi:hypothetical protein
MLSVMPRISRAFVSSDCGLERSKAFDLWQSAIVGRKSGCVPIVRVNHIIRLGIGELQGQKLAGAGDHCIVDEPLLSVAEVQ